MSFDVNSLYRVLDIAVGLLGALDRWACPPCPAIECLVVTLLWRLGCAQELITMLESRAHKMGLSEIKGVETEKNPLLHPTLVDYGTIILVRTIAAISNEVEFGIFRRPSQSKVDAPEGKSAYFYAR